jgi:hypothetical protein
MFRQSALFASLLLIACACPSLIAQPSVQTYRDADVAFRVHVRDYDFLHDDSPAAVQALSAMWSATQQAVLQLLAARSGATAQDIDKVLAQLDPADQSDSAHDDTGRPFAVQLASGLFLVTHFTGEAGTVFVAGFHNGHPILWTIDHAAASENDPRGLIAAWRADRAGGKCREENSGHPPGTCGPLYASVGSLPPDANGHPRFYIDAGYAQTMGATIGKQTSIWVWDGDAAHLLWIDWFDFMIDQKIGTEFSDSVLSIGQKEDFRTFFGCGSCEARQSVRKVRLTPTAVEDLGKESTTPELDLIDELFYRLANDMPCADIAAPSVSKLLMPQLIDAKKESTKIEPGWTSVGMLGDVSVQPNGDTEEVCFTADDIGRLNFKVHMTNGKPDRFLSVTQPDGNYEDCPR